MIKCFVENYIDTFSDDEISNIVSEFENNGINVKFKTVQRGIMNAAIDDLVPQILLFFNSDFYNSFLNIVTTSILFGELVGFLSKKIKQKKPKKIKRNAIEDENVKINIRIENVTIINPKSEEVDLEDYYRAFELANYLYSNQNTEKNIIEYDLTTKEVGAYTTFEYAKKNMNEKKVKGNE